MKRWHEEEILMKQRRSKMKNWPFQKEGLGRMRKHRPYEGDGCSMCQWEKYEKGQGKRKMRELEYEQLVVEGEA